MLFRDFDELKSKVRSARQTIVCAVVFPHDSHTINAVIRAEADGLIRPLLIGDGERIRELLRASGRDTRDVSVYHVPYEEAAIGLSIDMVHGEDADCIMKGTVTTRKIMRVLLKQENRFKKESLVSLLSFLEIDRYHKMVAFTDTGICPHPTLEQKRAILENAVLYLRDIGISCPKVAVVSPSDAPDATLPESIDAAALKNMYMDGTIEGCVVEGPISLDAALNPDAAERKGYTSEVAGDADLIVFPDLASATFTSKALTFATDKSPGTIMLGAKVPVILCSRASSMETKYLGIMLVLAGLLDKKCAAAQLAYA